MSTNVWRQRDGNLEQKAVETPAEMESAKAEGWKTTQEMWPSTKPEAKDKGK